MNRHTDPVTAESAPAEIAAHSPAHALCRRNVRRRNPAETRKPMMLLALGLNLLVVCVLLFVGCALMPVGAAMAALQARSWMAEQEIDMPEAGPLDGHAAADGQDHRPRRHAAGRA